MLSLVKIWRHRALVITLVGKELKTRYRASFMGFLWTLLNPLFMMLVYTLVFSVYMRAPVKNYAVFAFAGLLPWIWFSSALLQSAVSVVRDGHLLKKVSFPAEILPFVTVAASGVNFLFSLPLYLIFCLVYGVPLGWPLLALPVLLLLQFFLSYGLALILSAANVFFRDVEHLVGNLLTLLFFLTPIIYPVGLIPERFRILAMANPLAPLILAWRDALFNAHFPSATHLGLVTAAALLCLLIGERVFARLSPRFAERV